VRTGAGAGSGSEKLWEALVQSEVRFNKVAEKVPEKVWEAFVQKHVRLDGFRRRFNRRPGRLWCEEGSEKVPGSEKVRAGPGQVQQCSEEGSGEGSRKPWCRAKSGSTVPEKVWEIRYCG